MPLEKRCLKAGCNGYPLFGMGLPSRGLMRWACTQHRDLIWNGAPPAPGEGGQGSFSGLGPSSQPARQGSLF